MKIEIKSRDERIAALEAELKASQRRERELVEAWENYNKIDAAYTYSLEEGGDCEYTKREHSEAWKKLNDLFKRDNALQGREGVK